MPYLKINIMNYLKDKSVGVIYFSDFKLSDEKAKHVVSVMYLIPQQMHYLFLFSKKKKHIAPLIQQ